MILKSEDIVIYESTVYPGCTEEVCVPILEKCSGLKYLRESTSPELNEINLEQTKPHFTIGYSPERINPGDKEHNFNNITKVVSGSNKMTLNKIAKLYSSVISAGVHCVSSIKVAEASKVIENAQRDLNIAFVNELALIFDRLNINTSEVLQAAGTKWNFHSFKPGLVGGHCIGVDPFYLTYKAECLGYHPEIILAGRRINDNMAVFISQKTLKAIASSGRLKQGSKVTVLGITFKEDCPDLRNSLVPKIINELKSYGCDLSIHDPCCDPKEAMIQYGYNLLTKDQIRKSSAVILAVAHKEYRDWSINQWESVLVPEGVLIDVKGISSSNKLKKLGYKVWTL